VYTYSKGGGDDMVVVIVVVVVVMDHTHKNQSRRSRSAASICEIRTSVYLLNNEFTEILYFEWEFCSLYAFFWQKK